MKDYKKNIENILKDINIRDRINIVEEMLKSDFEHNKITKEEYEEYKNFFEQKLKELEEKEILKKQENEIKENTEENYLEAEDKVIAIQAREEFKRKMKVEQKEISFIPIYKGQMGKLPPKRNKEESQREAR